MKSWKSRLILSLFVSNIVLYLYGYTGKMQVIQNQSDFHLKIYSKFLVEVEKSNRQFSRNGKEETDDFSPKILSPHWIALKEMKNLYPELNFDFSPIDSDYENKPEGWSASFEKEGWIKSVFVLNGKSKHVFKISSYSKNELDQWRKMSGIIAAIVFSIFFGAGFFLNSNKRVEEIENKIKILLRKIHVILVETEYSISQLKVFIEKVEKAKPNEFKQALISLDQLANQIKILSVNGSIEGFKTSIDRKMIENLFLEINSIASKMSTKMKLDFPEISDYELQTIVKRFSSMHRIVEETLQTDYKSEAIL